jgi:ATP-dependent DNA helicase RecG
VGQDDGQNFDRKSLLAGPEGAKRSRDRREVRDQVARYVAAFADAEGGVLALGIEDDGTVTGHELPLDALQAVLTTPQNRLEPPQPAGFVVEWRERQVVIFDVPASDVPVKVTGDGFPLRMGDQTLEASESQILALKFQGLAASWEAKPSALGLEGLDLDLLARARRGAGHGQFSDEEYLLRRKLADKRGSGLVLRRAAELLFARHGPDHPNAGVRIFRVLGTERRLGVEHNVEERPRVEGNLVRVLEEAFADIATMIRRPSRLRGTRFQPVPEYPEFCWKEAVLNAVAHRDYAIEGRSIEVWFFDDRLEVTSPGGLSPEVTLDELLRGDRRHVSRNPRVVRALVDLGWMRDQGEGIPRMFAEMAGQFLPHPTLTAPPREFSVTLRNTPTLTSRDRDFIAKLGDTELNDEEFQALLEAYRHGRVDNARMREIRGLETLRASALLRRLRNRGLIDLHAAGAASYYTLPDPLRVGTGGTALDPDRGGFEGDRGGSKRIGGGSKRIGGVRSGSGGFEADRGGFEADRGEFLRAQGLPPTLIAALSNLGARPRKRALRDLLVELCALRAWTPSELGQLVGVRSDKLVERHLSPLVAEGRLERQYPDNTSHPEQAYRIAGGADQLPYQDGSDSTK